MNSSIYNTDILIHSIRGDVMDIHQFKGKKLIIVNVASACGYTPQYARLEELYREFKDDLVVLGCPCNDFGAQEPGDANEILQFCAINFGVSFPLSEKISILRHTHPLYAWVMSQGKAIGIGEEVRWNFQKYLINRDGSLHGCLPSSTDPLAQEVLDWVTTD